MTTHDARYDEDRGGPRHGTNPVSLSKDGDFYKATEKVLPWGPPGNHEQGVRGSICETQ